MNPLRITVCVCVAIFLLVVATDRSLGATPDQPPTRENNSVDFARDVYPILQRSCLECHGEQKQEGDLRLDIRDEALRSGIIEVNRSDDSELLRRILLPRGDDEVMPAIGDPLTKQQISIIRRWIQQGAPWPDDFKAGKHWSYIAPVRPQLPVVSDGQWVKSPVDRFVLRRLQDDKLCPSARATPPRKSTTF